MTSQRNHQSLPKAWILVSIRPPPLNSPHANPYPLVNNLPLPKPHNWLSLMDQKDHCISQPYSEEYHTMIDYTPRNASCCGGALQLMGYKHNTAGNGKIFYKTGWISWIKFTQKIRLRSDYQAIRIQDPSSWASKPINGCLLHCQTDGNRSNI